MFLENNILYAISGKRYKIINGVPNFVELSEITESNLNSTNFYNSWAPFYEFVQKIYYAFWGGEKKARNDYLQYLDIKDRDKVLEVSIGTGANIVYLPKGALYYGIDLSWEQLMQCRNNMIKRKLNIELFYGNAEELPFKDESFDVVYHIGGINTFNNKSKAIKEMIRVAKKGTTLLIADETEKVAKFYEKIPYFNRPFKNRKVSVTPPIDLLPNNIDKINLTEIRKGTLYCLTFRKL